MLRVLFLFLLISLTVKSQDPDTLLTYILKLENDTERVNQLYKQGFSLRNKQPQLAYTYAKYAEKGARQSSSKKHLAKSYNLLGILFYKKGQYKTAINYHKHALALRSEINDVLGIAQSQNNLGNVYVDIKLYGKAEQAYLHAMQAYKTIGNIEKVKDCLNNLGVIKHNLKQHNAAIENYKMALNFCEKNDYTSKAMYLSNMGEAYLGKHDTVNAIAINEDALEMRLMTDNIMEAGDSYVNLAGIYIVTGDYAKTKQYLRLADSIANAYDYFELKLLVLKISAFYNKAINNSTDGFQLLEDYYYKRDSIVAQQQMELLKYDFEEDFSQPIENDNYHGPIKNKFFMVVLLILIIFISFIIFKNKR